MSWSAWEFLENDMLLLGTYPQILHFQYEMDSGTGLDFMKRT